MSVLAVKEMPISPELVLVSPPEVARVARSLLSSPQLRAPIGQQEAKLVASQPGRAELAIVWLICIAMTLGPLIFLLVAARP